MQKKSPFVRKKKFRLAWGWHDFNHFCIARKKSFPISVLTVLILVGERSKKNVENLFSTKEVIFVSHAWRGGFNPLFNPPRKSVSGAKLHAITKPLWRRQHHKIRFCFSKVVHYPLHCAVWLISLRVMKWGLPSRLNTTGLN